MRMSSNKQDPRSLVGGLLCRVLLAAAILLSPSVTQASTSGQWSVLASAGYSPTSQASDKDGTFVLGLGVGKALDQHWLIRLLVERAAYDYENGGSARFTPIGLGARLYPYGREGRRPSLFIEAVPILAHSVWKDQYGNNTSRASPGLLEAVGIGIQTSANTWTELSLGYLFTRGTKQVFYDSPPLHYDGLGAGVIGLAVGLQFGH
jgi:hypothetical protein